MERRVFLAILLSFAVLVAWQYLGPKLFPEHFPAPGPPSPVVADGGTAPGAETPAAEPAKGPEAQPGTETPAAEAPAPAAEPEGPVPPAAPEEKVVLENDVVRAVLTSRGAAVAHWYLLGERFEEEGKDGGKPKPLDLVETAPDQPLPYATTFEPLGWPADASYRVVSKDARSVTFAATAGGVTVEKRFALTENRYLLEFDLTAKDAAGRAVRLTPTVHLSRKITEEAAAGGLLSRMTKPMPDVVQSVCAYDEKETERRRYDEDEPPFSYSGPVAWSGIDSRYFLTAVFQGVPKFEQKKDAAPETARPATCTLKAPTQTTFQAELALEPLDVPAGGSVSRRLSGYMGPKFKTRLSAYGHRLDDSIDFGIFTILSLGLLWVMVFFQSAVGNWGVAIILLTLAVKGVLLPLTNWSMRSMEKMRAIQPKMTALKDKYGKDPQRYQQEMMKMYREEGVSPFGGCLPMLLQLPIWFALYRTILNTAELYHAEFIHGWLTNLAAPEPGVVKFLPIAMGITMFLMQKMQPTQATGDDAQAKMQKYMLYFMPPFFTFIMYGLPSGLTLYIFVNNILSIFQQLWIRKRQEAARAAA